MWADEDTAATIAKDYFQRKRPWLEDRQSEKLFPGRCAAFRPIPAAIPPWAMRMAVVLANLIPAKGQAIMARAADYAENRLVCGMHRRRDIQAGQVLGTAVAEIPAAQTRLPAGISGRQAANWPPPDLAPEAPAALQPLFPAAL